MSRKLVFILCLLLLLLSLLFNLVEVKAPNGAIVVPDNYLTIQEAINHANPGDTIYVSANTYVENVIVNKSVFIIGENKYTTIVDGNGTDTVFYVTASNVVIAGFTILNGSKPPPEELWAAGVVLYSVCDVNVSDNIFVNNFCGIAVRDSDRVNLANNLLMDNVRGIILSSSRENVLRNNNITRCYYSFGVASRSVDRYMHDVDTSNTVDGKPIYYLKNQQNLIIDPTTYPNIGYLALVNSTNIVIKDLSLQNNYQGVLLVFTTHVTVQNVTVMDNSYGISLSYSHENNVKNVTALNNYCGVSVIFSSWNTVSDCILANGGYGITLGGFMSQPPGCHDNTIIENKICNNLYGLSSIDAAVNNIYHNNFINNEQQFEEIEYWNNWENGYPSGGNYWSDYTGVDLNSGPYQNETGSDGIGDTPYVPPYHNGDHYPLMKPYPWAQHDLGITNIVSKTVVGQGYGLHVDVTIFNYGNSTENFNVTAYAGTVFIGTFMGVILASRNSTKLSFLWNTTSVAKGNCTINVVVTPVIGEAEIFDNNFTGWVVVTIPGDVNGDFRVEGKDVAIVSKAYDTRPGSPRWNSNADINGDFRVEGKDVAILAKNYGRSA